MVQDMRTLLLVLVACQHAPALSPSTVPLPPVGPNTMGWPAWSHEKKLEYMQRTVMPAEREIFARFEPLRFADMTCATCHGQGARDGSYKMPNPDLPHIVGGKGGFEELATVQPETVRFMQKVVGPETAHLLGYSPFDMEQHVGFSCYQCHVREDIKP